MDTSEKNSHIGARIREARLRCRLTQEELADAIGVGREQIAKLETGVTLDPRASTLDAIARALGTSVDLLIRSAA